jgi:hypothetical protein
VTHREPPRWLADLQRAFSSALRAPLDRSTLTLRAREESYGAEILGEVLPRGDTTPAARLAVYNRQYWFRLFTVLQGEFPLTARVAGFWSFNALAERHLLERPPSSFDIGQAADGFEAMIRRLDDGDLPPALRDRHLALHDAANIDEAFRAVASSPDEPAVRPGPDDTAALLEHGLAASSRWRLVEERFALLELRQRLCGAPVNDERPIALPAAHPSPQTWALVRRARGFGHIPLSPAHAALLMLLQSLPLGQALQELERRFPAERNPELPGKVQRWLARSVELGFWTGLGDAPGGPPAPPPSP